MNKNKEVKKLQKEEAERSLRMFVEKVDYIYTRLDSAAASGLSRRLSCFVGSTYQGKNTIVNITYYVATLLDKKRNRLDGGITVSGCGFDAGFAVVESLNRYLFGHNDPARGALKQEWI